MNIDFRSIVTVTLNPTIDRIIEVPGFSVGGHQHGCLRVREPAGKAINVSRALSELGVVSSAIGWVGMNAFDLFHETMQRACVKACFLPITGLTRENITIIDPQSHLETHIRDAGPTVEDADVKRLLDLLTTVANNDSLVIFTGSVPPGLSLDTYTALLTICVQQGAKVAIDAEGDPLKRAVSQALWMVKPNEQELAELMGVDRPDEAFILRSGRELNERIPVVLVTAGRRGAYCFAEGQCLHAVAELQRNQVTSTVGCGDAMLAGFLSGLMRNQGDMAAALREGVAISAAAVLTDKPARFMWADVERIRGKVTLRTLA